MGFDLRLSEEQQALRDTLHELAQRVLRPRAREAEEARRTPADVLAAVHEIGVTAPVAEAYGGGGTLDPITYCIVAEELAWGDPGIAHHALGVGLVAIVLGAAGSDRQKETRLPAFATGPVASFVAIDEKLAAGDLDGLATTIDGDKTIGEKYGVIEAGHDAFGIVVGRAREGLGAVLVEGGSYEVVREESKLGLEAAPTWVARFDQVGEAVPAGPELTQALLWAKLATGAVAVGCARASLEYASQYATEREAFGRPIGAFQAISFKIADMAIDVDAARGSVWNAAWKIGRGEATVADVAAANGHALSAAVRAGDESVQVLGGHGYITDHPVEKWFRDAVTLSVSDAPQVMGDLAVSGSTGGV